MTLLAQTVSATERAEFIAFVVLAPLALLTAIGMVMNRDAVRSALLLVVNLFCLAVFYLFLQAPFLAAVQVIVYAGAIMVLFLFVLMLLGIDRTERLLEPIGGQRPVAILLGLGLLVVLAGPVVLATIPSNAAGVTAANEAVAGGNVEAVGRLLFTRYTLAFQATGILLLVAGIGAVVLAKRHLDGEDPVADATDTTDATDPALPASGDQDDSASSDGDQPDPKERASPDRPPVPAGTTDGATTGTPATAGRPEETT